jgi:hypothetical protein
MASHGLGEAVDRRPPLLAEEKQDGRDERAGVADADPPDEVDDVERPADGDVVAPDADAGQQELADRQVQEHQQRKRDPEAEEPTDRRATRQDDGANRVGDGVERVARRDDRRRPLRHRVEAAGVGDVFLGGHQWFPSPSALAAVGGSKLVFGFRTIAKYVVRGRVFSSSSRP